MTNAMGKFRVILFELIVDEEQTSKMNANPGSKGLPVYREVQVGEATGGAEAVASAMHGFAIGMGVRPAKAKKAKPPKRKAKTPQANDDADARAMLADPAMRGVMEKMLGKDAIEGIEKLMSIHDAFTGQPKKAEQS